MNKDGTATDFERVFNVNRLNILPSSVNFNRFEISYRPRRPRKSNPKHLRFKPYVNDIVFKSSNNFSEFNLFIHCYCSLRQLEDPRSSFQ